MSRRIFFDRRSGGERRSGRDQRRNPRLDLPGRHRRRRPDRRARRSLVEDYYAFHDAGAGERCAEPAGATTARPGRPRRKPGE